MNTLHLRVQVRPEFADYLTPIFVGPADALQGLFRARNSLISAPDVLALVSFTLVNGPGLETGGYARIGDPFDLTTGGSSIAFSVPEPSVTLILGILGALALAVWRERKKQQR